MVNGARVAAMAEVRSYKDLDVWQSAMTLAADVYKATASLPREELYGLTGQMRRASVSIASNIAEGYGRESTQAFIPCLRIAQGSSKELETQIEIAHRVDLLNSAAVEALIGRSDQVGKMLRGLIRSLEAKTRGN
jgi:four helix bundle protein